MPLATQWLPLFLQRVPKQDAVRLSRAAPRISSTILIFEEWADRDAFDFHHAQEYTKDVFAKYEGWLESEPELIEVKPLKG